MAWSTYFVLTVGQASYGLNRASLSFARFLLRQAWLCLFLFIMRSADLGVGMLEIEGAGEGMRGSLTLSLASKVRDEGREDSGEERGRTG